jgi:hypothetical protein
VTVECLPSGVVVAGREVKITVETERVIAIEGGPRSQAVCPHCGKQVWMVSAEDAAVLAGVSVRTVHRWTRTAEIHMVETSDGLLLSCCTARPETER